MSEEITKKINMLVDVLNKFDLYFFELKDYYCSSCTEYTNRLTCHIGFLIGSQALFSMIEEEVKLLRFYH
jgi:hypothetical protein